MGRFAVIGGGVAGLSAAFQFERDGHSVVLFEASDRIGGKVRSSAVPALAFPLDDGADAFLARVPDALELCAELGLDDLVHPANGKAWVYARDALRPLPHSHLLGIPTDLDDLAATGLISAPGLARAAADLESVAPAPTTDVSVGALVRERLGDEVCENLVEPLLGGINGGEADGLSAQASAPQIWACAAKGGSLMAAAAAMRAATIDVSAPVFAAPRAGMAAIPTALAAAIDAEVRTGVQSVPITTLPSGGVEVNGEHFDGAVVATPADVAGTLLSSIDRGVADTLRGWEFASVAMVTVVARRDDVDHDLDGSGFIVSRRAGLSITAGSWASSKWAHWDDGQHAVFRVSLGHDSDPFDWCATDDAHLTRTALADLETVLGTSVRPAGVRIGRWPRSFPQYRPGHLDRVEQLRGSLRDAGPVAVVGMSLDGIGVPACIRGGRSAARALAG